MVNKPTISRCRAAADEGYAFAVFFNGNLRETGRDVVLEIGGNPFQTADSHRVFFNPSPTTGRFTGTVADSAEDAGKDVGVPVDHIGIRIPLFRYQTEIFRDRGVGRAGILTVYDFVKVFRIVDICRFQELILIGKDGRAYP